MPIIRYLLILSIIYTSAKAQVSLDLRYCGNDESTSIDLFEYVNYISPTRKKIKRDYVLNRNSIESLALHMYRPVQLFISNQSISEAFFVQPENNYSITISDSGISIQSSDNINKAISMLDSAIDKYYDDLFELTDNSTLVNQNQVFGLLSDLEAYGNKWGGTDFQNEIIKYKTAFAKNVTFGLLHENGMYFNLEQAYLLDRPIQLNNSAYIEFLFDHYFRRIRQLDLLKSEYSDDHTVFEIINLEVATISNPVIQQIALLMLANEAYNSNWVNDNSEVIQVFDSLMITGLDEQIRDAANKLFDRVTNLQPGSTIPDFSFLNMDGNDVKLSQYFEKYILLDFWFIGCRPCEMANPHKVRLYEKYGDKLEILSINNHNSLPEIVNYKNKKGHPWTFLKVDKNDSVLSTLNIQSYPTYYMLDREGKIILNPKRNDSIEKIFSNIESVLSERSK